MNGLTIEELELYEQLTLERLLQHTVEDGECLRWTGHAHEGKRPQIRLGGAAGHAVNVRRVLWLLTRGPLRAGLQVGVKCECELCVHPDCLVARTKSAAQRGRSMPLERRRRIAMTKRRASDLTPDTVREIRFSDEPGKALDIRLGLTVGYSSRIRRGEVWADFSSGVDMLGAR